MAVQVNEIGTKALVDMGTTHTCVVRDVAACLGLEIEAYDSLVTSLNGRDHWVDGIIRSCPMEMGDWVGCCDLVVMHLRDFEMIMGMNFLTRAEVSIIPYLRTLAFMEKGTSCTVLAVENQIMKTKDGARLCSSTKHSGGWFENRDNGLWKPWQSLGLRQDQAIDDSMQFDSTRMSTSISEGGFIAPFAT